MCAEKRLKLGDRVRWLESVWTVIDLFDGGIDEDGDDTTQVLLRNDSTGEQYIRELWKVLKTRSRTGE